MNPLYEAFGEAWQNYLSLLNSLEESKTKETTAKSTVAEAQGEIAKLETEIPVAFETMQAALKALYEDVLDVPPLPPTPVFDSIGTTTTLGGPAIKATNGVWAITATKQLTRDGVILPETNNITSLVIEASPLDATKTTVRQFAWGTSWSYAPGFAGANAAGWVMATVTPPVTPPTTPPVTPPVNNSLTLFKATDVIKHDYGRSVWHPVEGFQSGKMQAGWSFDYNALTVQPDGSLLHRLTNTQAAAIKWEGEKRLKKTQGHYVTEATFGTRPGVVYNPLWLFSEGDPTNGGHEFDFEYMDGRLEYNLHSPGGYNMKSVQKDLNGHRCRWEIIRRPEKTIMKVTSLKDGWTDSLEITPAIVANWKATRTGVPANIAYPKDTVAMFPMTELWVANQGWGLDPWNGDTTPWSGKWVPLPAGETVDMVIHGYNFSA